VQTPRPFSADVLQAGEAGGLDLSHVVRESFRPFIPEAARERAAFSANLTIVIDQIAFNQKPGGRSPRFFGCENWRANGHRLTVQGGGIQLLQ
jgi:hypothetical protein